LAVLAGVVAVGGLQRRPAVTGQVVRGAEPGHELRRVHGDDVAGGLAADDFQPRAEVDAEARRDHPVVLRVQRRGVDVDDGALGGNPVLHARDAGGEDGHRDALRIDDRLAAGEQVVGLEHVVRRALRIAAGMRRAVVLAAPLQVVRAGASRGQRVRHAAGELLVVPLFGIERTEERRRIVQRRWHAGHDDAAISVFVPPAFTNSKVFCEYCNVAKYLFESTPLYVVTNSLFGMVSVTSTDGSREEAALRLGRSCWTVELLVKSPEIVCAPPNVCVSFNSPRLLVSTRVYEPPVCTNVFGCGLFS